VPSIVNLPGGPWEAGATRIYSAQIVTIDDGSGVSASDLATITLTIVNTLSGSVVNGVSQVDIFNTGRGTLDTNGNLTIKLLPADTSMDDVPGIPQVQRSLIIDWATIGGSVTGRHQVNFILVALAGS
jgi:hypothetical protein